MSAEEPRFLMLTERTRFGDETGAGLMRNRCAFTSKDMAATFGDAFAYAIILGWEDPDEPEMAAMDEQIHAWGWDHELVAFIRDTHERFKLLADKIGGDA